MAASAGSSITLTPGGGFLLEKTGSATILVPETLSDEQRLMKQTADDFMRREVEPLTAQIDDKKPGLMRELLRKSGEVGLLGHDVPEEYGGLGGDKTSSSLIFEAASRQGSFAVSFGAHVGIGTMPLVLFGTVATAVYLLLGITVIRVNSAQWLALWAASMASWLATS